MSDEFNNQIELLSIIAIFVNLETSPTMYEYTKLRAFMFLTITNSSP